MNYYSRLTRGGVIIRSAPGGTNLMLARHEVRCGDTYRTDIKYSLGPERLNRDRRKSAVSLMGSKIGTRCDTKCAQEQ